MTCDPKTHDPETCDPTTRDPETCDPKEAGVQEARSQEARIQEARIQEARDQEVRVQIAISTKCLGTPLTDCANNIHQLWTRTRWEAFRFRTKMLTSIPCRDLKRTIFKQVPDNRNATSCKITHPLQPHFNVGKLFFDRPAFYSFCFLSSR